VLHSFAGGKKDGCNPLGGLIADNRGNLYGTTYSCGAFNYGTVFKLSPEGKETVLHSFSATTTDGAYPYLTNLLIVKSGNIYGVTQAGGRSGDGVVYELEQGGTFKVLYSFAGGTKDGCNPVGTPSMDKFGNLYGATQFCGSASSGTVWEVTQQGVEAVLHSFQGGGSDGSYPSGGVLLDSKGNLYGTTMYGGAFDGNGTVYQLSGNGQITLLHSFAWTDGAYPSCDLLRDSKGVLYGTTYYGGSYYYYGTVWSQVP